jgi:stage II sporulation protein D
LKDVSSARITGGSGGRLLASDGRLIQEFPENMQLDLSSNTTGLIINGVPVSDTSLSLVSARSNAYLQINGQEVATRLTLRRGNGQTFSVIAQIDVEDYLHGVLAGEVPFATWHSEALKAQAVASRSYAYNQIQHSSGKPYDVESTVMSQVFKPGFRSNPIIHAACEATRGLVLTCDGHDFPAYFHSTCGGHTAPAAGIFQEYANLKTLRGATCSYCQKSPSYRWSITLRKDAIVTKLRTQYPGLESIHKLEFLDAQGTLLGQGVSGRAMQVRIQHSGGTLTLQANAFRLLVGPKELKALQIEQFSEKTDSIDVVGGGFGHGVGLCQFGSQGMATSGRNYSEILGLYYPNAALTRMW